MSDKLNLNFVGQMKPQRFASIEEDSRNELAQIHVDQARFAKYGTNNAKKAELIESGEVEEEIRERFQEEG